MAQAKERFFEQIVLPPEHLDQGFFGPHNYVAPWTYVLSLDESSFEHFTNAGISMHESWDQLDMLKGAVISLLPEKNVISIIKHLNHPLNHVEICSDENFNDNYAKLTQSLQQKFGITQKQIIWTKTIDN